MDTVKTSLLSSIFRQREGKLTRDLVRTPGKFGLGQTPTRLQPTSVTSMVCGYCSTGCGLNIHLKNNQAINLTPDANYPVNLGMACPKGWEALTPLVADDRALTPLLRNAQGTLADATWDDALKAFTSNFKRIIAEHGPEAVAFLSTGQIPTEEMFMLGTIAKFGMGFIHGDANTRQCMATSHVAYKQAFGFDAPPFSYQDFEESDTLVFVGANPCIAHPIMWERVCMNPNHPNIIVVDPRQTETALAATHHYALQPKSDLTLLYGLAHILIRNDWIDKTYIADHVNDFDAFKNHVAEFTPQMVSYKTGLSEEQIYEFVDLIRLSKRVSFWWTMGVNQSHEGVRAAQAIINLALITGNMGRPGTGANSITGQVNAMGSRLYSNTTSLVGGHDFLNAEHRQKIATLMDMDVNLIPQKNTLAYDQIIEKVRTGEIKGLWVIATNPVHSWVDQNNLRKAFANLEFLAVQDMYTTSDTAKLAHVVFPAAGWGEKEGSVINSERRIGLFKKVSAAPGQALADFYIFKLLAKYWGCDKLFANYTKPEDAFQMMKKISAAQPCDITGIEDYQHIDKQGGIQWPYPLGKEPKEKQRRLFENGKYYHADGKAKLLFDPIKPLPEEVTPEFPFALLTGRASSAQWHTNTRTAKSAVLRKLYVQNCYVEIHPEDAKELGVNSGDTVNVSSKRGSIEAKVFVASTMQRGQVYIPMHYDGLNQLTFPAFDAYSRQPSYKHCAVRVDKV